MARAAASPVELRLDDDAARLALATRLELQQLGLQRHHLEQLLDAFAIGCGDLDTDRLPAELLRDDLVLQQCLLDPLGVGLRLVDLVDGDDHRHARGLGVVDGLDRLRHHAVVRGDHQDDDVGHLGTAGAHLREGSVSRGVDERDEIACQLGLVGADVLGDPSGLAADHVGLANRVQQRGLAVVDVPHDRHDGGARLDGAFLGPWSTGGGHRLLGLGLHVLDLVLEFLGEQRGSREIDQILPLDFRVEGGDPAQQVPDLEACLLREVVEADRAPHSHHLALGRGRRQSCLEPRPGLGATHRLNARLLIDEHAPALQVRLHVAASLPRDGVLLSHGLAFEHLTPLEPSLVLGRRRCPAALHRHRRRVGNRRGLGIGASPSRHGRRSWLRMRGEGVLHDHGRPVQVPWDPIGGPRELGRGRLRDRGGLRSFGRCGLLQLGERLRRGQLLCWLRRSGSRLCHLLPPAANHGRADAFLYGLDVGPGAELLAQGRNLFVVEGDHGAAQLDPELGRLGQQLVALEAKLFGKLVSPHPGHTSPLPGLVSCSENCVGTPGTGH